MSLERDLHTWSPRTLDTFGGAAGFFLRGAYAEIHDDCRLLVHGVINLAAEVEALEISMVSMLLRSDHEVVTHAIAAARSRGQAAKFIESLAKKAKSRGEARAWNSVPFKRIPRLVRFRNDFAHSIMGFARQDKTRAVVPLPKPCVLLVPSRTLATVFAWQNEQVLLGRRQALRLGASDGFAAGWRVPGLSQQDVCVWSFQDLQWLKEQFRRTASEIGQLWAELMDERGVKRPSTGPP